MALMKPFLLVAAVGFLGACEELIEVEPMPGAGLERGMVSPSLVGDPAVASRLDVAAQSGNAITYAYYTDVIGETAVRAAAIAFCGGQGKAKLRGGGAGTERSVKGGRGYNKITFICLA